MRHILLFLHSIITIFISIAVIVVVVVIFIIIIIVVIMVGIMMTISIVSKPFYTEYYVSFENPGRAIEQRATHHKQPGIYFEGILALSPGEVCLFLPASSTNKCMSQTELLRQFHLLPH